jgi:hypothetical protein
MKKTSHEMGDHPQQNSFCGIGVMYLEHLTTLLQMGLLEGQKEQCMVSYIKDAKWKCHKNRHVCYIIVPCV